MASLIPSVTWPSRIFETISAPIAALLGGIPGGELSLSLDVVDMFPIDSEVGMALLSEDMTS
jgi:hypothetical protein